MSPAFKVALLVETSNRYGRDLLYGVRDWMHGGEKWTVRLTERSRLAPLPAWIKDWNGDGILARVDSNEIAAQLRRTRLPVVNVSAERFGSEFPRVSIDNAAVARLAYEHLFNKGLRTFAYIGDARFIWSTERGAEFNARACGAGYECFHFRLKSRSAPPPGTDAEAKSILRWIDSLPKPVGIFACYDGRGQQVLEACQSLGVKVPDEVAVIGVDNDELLCELCSPPLTSVLPNARVTGYEAAQMLSRMMRGEAPGCRTRYVEPVRVIERQSTDAIAVPDAKIAAAVRFIHEHACDRIQVGDVLREVPMSRTLFEQRFKAILGHTPHRHILDRKLERARSLLVETELPMTIVAELAGFETASYLSTVFRREYALSPYAYRKQRRPRKITNIGSV
jgi:LacI family transcriptional regulator